MSDNFVAITDVISQKESSKKDPKLNWADCEDEDTTNQTHWKVEEQTVVSSINDIQAEQVKEDKPWYPEKKEENKQDKYVNPNRRTGGGGGSGGGFGSGERRRYPKNMKIPDKPPYIAKVENISFKVDDNTLRGFFENFGFDVYSAKVVRDRDSGDSKGYGYVEFNSADDLRNALNKNEELMGRKIEVSVKPEQRDYGGNRDNNRENRDYGDKGYGKRYSFQDRNQDRRSPPRERQKLNLTPKKQSGTGTGDDQSNKNESIFGTGKFHNTEYDIKDTLSEKKTDDNKRDDYRRQSDNRRDDNRRDDNRRDDNRRYNDRGGSRYERGSGRGKNWQNRGPVNNTPQVTSDGFQVRGGKKKTNTRQTNTNLNNRDNDDESNVTFVTENKFSILLAAEEQ